MNDQVTVFEGGKFVRRANFDVLVPAGSGRKVRYLGNGFTDTHAGEVGTVVAHKSVHTWIIRVLFDNGDLVWLADHDCEGV